MCASRKTLRPDRWTSELDQLAYEKNVLFVVAAGNNGEVNVVAGADRVQAPERHGQRIGSRFVYRGISRQAVGRAPYSAVGPGDLATVCSQRSSSSENRHCTVSCAHHLRPVAQQLRNNFAARSWFMHSRSQQSPLGPEADPNSLRAMAVHFAEPHRAFRQKVTEVGHGRAKLTLLARSTARRKGPCSLPRHDRAWPGTQLQASGTPGCTDRVAMRITCSCFSPVEPAEGVGVITRASLGMTLRPNRFVYGFTSPTTSKSQPLDFTHGGSPRALHRATRSVQPRSLKMMNRLEVANEAKQREAGKWETVRSHAIGFNGPDLDGQFSNSAILPEGRVLSTTIRLSSHSPWSCRSKGETRRTSTIVPELNSTS